MEVFSIFTSLFLSSIIASALDPLKGDRVVGKIIAIYVCPAKGQPMEEVRSIEAITGVGLKGDRYALGTGAWSNSTRITTRHVSLIAIEAILEANQSLSQPFLPRETRRNLLTEGIDLNALVDQRFLVGKIMMRGVELCTPCKRPTSLTGKRGFEAAFDQRGGLRAEILLGGIITVGDDVASTLVIGS